jgi:hypothetical protein
MRLKSRRDIIVRLPNAWPLCSHMPYNAMPYYAVDSKQAYHLARQADV